MAVHSSWVSTPQPSSDRACARLARMSTSRRTASIPSDRFIFSKTGSLSSSNRPCHSFILMHHQPRSYRCRQAEKVDEPFGVMMIVTAGVERCDVLPVKAEWRFAALHSHRALVELHCHRAGHDFLCFREERVERFPQRSEPLAFIHHLGIGDGQHVFLVTSLAVKNKGLQLAMRRSDQRPARSFINTARFHPDDPILDAIGAADPVGAGDFIKIFEELYRTNAITVKADRNTLFEVDRDFAFTFRTRSWIECQHE